MTTAFYLICDYCGDEIKDDVCLEFTGDIHLHSACAGHLIDSKL